MTASRSSGESFLESLLHHPLGLLGLNPLIWRKSLIFNLFRECLTVLFATLGGIHGVRKSFILSLAEVVHQKIPGDRRNPSIERGLACVKAGERSIHPNEDFLGQVLGVVSRPGKTVADVVDAPVKQFDDVLPCDGISGYTLPN